MDDFLSGVMEYGVPGKVRADGGSEFNHVAKFMNQVDGTERCIRGKSVHNERIERLWRDVFEKVASNYHAIFTRLTNYGVLSDKNPVQMFVLHHVYLPRLQADLREWRNTHNHHPVSTAGNQTPLRLWHESFILHANSEYSSIQNVLFSTDDSRREEIRSFRENNDFPEPDDIKIKLSRVPSPISEARLEELHRTIDVTRQSPCNGIDIYQDVMRFVRGAIRSDA